MKSSSTEVYKWCIDNLNSSDYERIDLLTGGSTSDEDVYISIKEVSNTLGPLSRHSFLRIENNDVRLLDFLIWFQIDLYKHRGWQPIRVQFSLPKHIFDAPANIPILNKKGTIINLEKRCR